MCVAALLEPPSVAGQLLRDAQWACCWRTSACPSRNDAGHEGMLARAGGDFHTAFVSMGKSKSVFGVLFRLFLPLATRPETASV